jgi:tRNA U55 pseudouridine synthase TruB
VEWREKIQGAIEEIKLRNTQIPPQYSAIKLQGTPAYERARRGETLNIKPKPATLHECTIHNIEKMSGVIHVRLTMCVSAGFYIRSFARDLGEILGVGGLVQTLKRTKIGRFSLKNALILDDFNGIVNLYIQPKNLAKNVDFEQVIFEMAKSENIQIQHTNETYIITGTWNVLQDFLVQVKVHAKHYDAEISDWFGCI